MDLAIFTLISLGGIISGLVVLGCWGHRRIVPNRTLSGSTNAERRLTDENDSDEILTQGK